MYLLQAIPAGSSGRSSDFFPDTGLALLIFSAIFFNDEVKYLHPQAKS